HLSRDLNVRFNSVLASLRFGNDGQLFSYRNQLSNNPSNLVHT
ncbi:4673_t:CDS:1, partial [Gigaspora rosea]